MLVFALLVPVVLVITQIVFFPKTKGTLKSIKVPVDKNRF